MSLRDRLASFVKDLDMELDGELNEDTPLITSGLFDSTALLELASWIEKQVNKPVDPAQFNLVEEWNTISNIVNFIEKNGK